MICCHPLLALRVQGRPTRRAQRRKRLGLQNTCKDVTIWFNCWRLWDSLRGKITYRQLTQYNLGSRLEKGFHLVVNDLPFCIHYGLVL